jgi:hypothetical protein
MEKIREVSNTAIEGISFAKWTYFQTDCANQKKKAVNNIAVDGCVTI